MTSQEQWTAVDRYIEDRLLPSDPVMDAVLHASADAGLPAIQVTPAQGKLLMLLALAQGARSILEVGTLGGYSTIWLARALPADGRVVTLEAEARHAEVAAANFARSGLSHLIELRVGRALDTLPQLAAEGRGPFDFIFIDADKLPYADYFDWAIRLSRPGTVIVGDNVIRDGAVLDAGSEDPSVRGVRRLNEFLAADPRVTATAIQTVGAKGYDGFVFAIVRTTTQSP